MREHGPENSANVTVRKGNDVVAGREGQLVARIQGGGGKGNGRREDAGHRFVEVVM